VNLSAALLCDYAVIRDGLLNVQGGGIRQLMAEGVPMSPNIFLALAVEVAANELDSNGAIQIPLEVEVRRRGSRKAAGKVRGLASSQRKPEIGADIGVTVPVVIGLLGVVLSSPGLYIVRAKIARLTAAREFELTIVGSEVPDITGTNSTEPQQTAG
jgi:hypothetical protein